MPAVLDTFELPDQYYEVAQVDLTKANSGVRIDFTPGVRNLAVIIADDAFNFTLNDGKANPITVRKSMTLSITNYSNQTDDTGIQHVFVTNTASTVANAVAVFLGTGRTVGGPP